MMLNLLSTAVVELDGEGRIQQMNPAAEDCLAIGRERAQGMAFRDIDRVPVNLVNAIATTNVEQHGRRLRECRLAGGWFDCSIQPLPEQRTLLEFHDLKWQKQQNKMQQREVQTGMMDLLRRNLGHEIRNPLGGIRGAAQMMAAELNGSELSTLAKLIMREVDRVDELLARFGRPELELSKVDIHYVLQETTELLRLESADSVEIIHDYDPSIPVLNADASALRQLFLNLFLNAFQAGSSRLELKTRVDYSGSVLTPGISRVLRIDVVDDGDGVPESLRSMLFLPMVTSRRDGTGLGLALAQQIAAAHEGLLSYEPRQRGSRFTLRLPLERSND
jgi:two-component system nitrogen regulation sensor histidine kinase GlnL